LRRQGPFGALQKTPVALILTTVAGFIDVFGYVFIYGVYVAHMTGNTVATARHLVDLQFYGLLRHSWPIVTFVIGLLIGAFILDAQLRRPIAIGVSLPLLLEAVLLGAFIAAASGINFTASIPTQPAGRYYLTVALLALAMGMQNVVVRKVGGLNVYTTFITGTLVKFAEAASGFAFWFRDRTHHRWRARLGKVVRVAPHQRDFLHVVLTGALFLAYFVGAYCGTLAGLKYELKAMFIPLGILVGLTVYSAIRPFAHLTEEEW
jgi:uncharacterized membrane protein YoaK (UPF0700 family)